MSAVVNVRHLADDKFEITVRGHEMRVDQPVDGGGEDTGPAPTELFVASLASCVGFYARRFLSRHGLPTEGLAVEASYDMESRPARVGQIRVRVEVPLGVPEASRDALLAVASHCTVHNSLVQPPAVDVELTPAAPSKATAA
jgi:putative redox protein